MDVGEKDMKSLIETVRATVDEQAQKDEGNAFTKALNAARQNGDAEFTVAGKKYKCEDYDDVTEDADEFKPHIMYDPKTGKGYKADKPEDHERMKKMGYVHDKPDMKEAMDPVKDKEAKKKFDDRDDKDIDNDGDVDSSDKFLHKRRKAISKSKQEDEPKGGEDTAEMNPKKEDKVTKESTVRDRLMSIWEDAAHTKGATKPEEMDSKDSLSAKKMKADHKVEVDNTDEKGHDDAAKAGRTGPKAKARNSGDNTTTGDKKIINKIAAAYKGMKNGD